MSEVVLKIPRSTRNAKVAVPSEEYYKYEDLSKSDSNVSKRNRHSLLMVANRRREMAKKVVFTEKFVISDSNQPLQISLKKVFEPSLTLSEAKIEIQKSYDNGFSDGQEAAELAYQTEIDHYKEVIRNFDNIAKELRSDYYKQIKKLENTIIPTSVMIAKHIIMNEFLNNEEVIVKRFVKAIEMADDDTIFKIQLNPEDVDILKSIGSNLVASNVKVDNIEIVPDNRILRGGCILFTSAGLIDMSIESQLQKIEQTLESLI